ncbi:hypothetical protein ACIQ7D_30375 [Streptomyces sp. NPDC096310]|uniref:hypothetical protein n=1 Tax=Streptomyces sp. NPDC096310 TaxID=3366082 RepID=UPI003810294F
MTPNLTHTSTAFCSGADDLPHQTDEGVRDAFDRYAENLVQRSATLFMTAEARQGIAALLERRDAA